MASFLMGNMNGNSYFEIQFRPATTNYQYGIFAQDNWKVTPKLTLNLGLRYDVTLPRTDRYNRQNWFDPNVASPLDNGSVHLHRSGERPDVTINLHGRRGLRHSQSPRRTTSPTGMTFSRVSASPTSSLRRWWCAEDTEFTTAIACQRHGSRPLRMPGFNQYTNVISDLSESRRTLRSCT